MSDFSLVTSYCVYCKKKLKLLAERQNGYQDTCQNEIEDLKKQYGLNMQKNPLTKLFQWLRDNTNVNFSSIDELEQCEELYLKNMKLTDLTDSIGLLENLKVLNLQDNKLISLPESIGQLKNF